MHRAGAPPLSGAGTAAVTLRASLPPRLAPPPPATHSRCSAGSPAPHASGSSPCSPMWLAFKLRSCGQAPAAPQEAGRVEPKRFSPSSKVVRARKESAAPHSAGRPPVSRLLCRNLQWSDVGAGVTGGGCRLGCGPDSHAHWRHCRVSRAGDANTVRCTSAGEQNGKALGNTPNYHPTSTPTPLAGVWERQPAGPAAGVQDCQSVPCVHARQNGL